MKRVVVTGMGMLSPIGNTLKQSWSSALAGKSGIDKISLFDPSELPVQIAGEVKGFDASQFMDPKDAKRTTRFIQLAVGASKEALEDAGLLTLTDEQRESFGVSVGVGMGSIEFISDNAITMNNKGAKRVSPFLVPYSIPNMASGIVASSYGLKGPNICTTTACTSGTHGIGEGFLLIKNGMAERMLVGGAEACISQIGVAAFGNMKALCRKNENPQAASRPFDKNRSGFVMGEGAGILILEELETAKKRGAKIYAEVSGYGMSGDAYHITSPAPEGEGAQRCMKMALRTGGININDVDYINAHGTSTPLNDMYESKAIGHVFGDHASKLAISSTKSVTGHLLGGAGGVEACFTAMSIKDQVVPPTINLEERDPDCPWDYVPGEAREMRVENAISNSFGFGGTNGTITLKNYK
jgi:3-oxoacyl-[acyl-carrier-protein] synthase II